MVLRMDSLRTAVAPSLADILRAVPLVLVRTNSRGEVELSVRGSESRQVGIMLDGLPLSGGWDGRADPSLIPTSGISQLTYVRATSTVLAGPNAVGGVIDLLTSTSQARGLEPALSLGSDETGARLMTGSVARTSELGSGAQLTWRAGGGLRALDGIVRARGVPDPIVGAGLRTNTDLSARDAFASLAWKAPGGAGISAMVTGYDMTRGVAPELHLNEPRLWRYPHQSRRVAQLRVQSRRFDSRTGTTELELGGGLLRGETQIEKFTDATYRTVDATEHGDEQVTNARFAATHRFTGGPELRAAITSNQVRYDESLSGAPSSRFRQSLLSVGAETRWLVWSRTLLSGGFVYDRAESIEAGGMEPLGPKDDLGWRLGATVLAGMTTRFHASASRRARFPALRELYSGSLGRFVPNPDLRPERLLAAEAGVSLGDPRSMVGTVAQFTAFNHWLADGVVRVAVPSTNRFTRINRDETRTVGVEAMMGWRGGARGPSLLGDLVVQQVRIRDAAAGASRKPEHMPSFRAMLDGALPVVARMTLGASVAHVGAQSCINPELGRNVRLAPQTITGATLQRSWGIGDRRGGGFNALRVLAGVDNFSNAAIYEQCGLPRAGRTLRIGVELR